MSEAKVNYKSSRTDLYYKTTTSYLPTTLHTLHIKSTHLLTVEALHLSDASSCEPQLQALAAAHLLQELLDPLHRPRPAQQRLRPPSSSQASRVCSLDLKTFEEKGWWVFLKQIASVGVLAVLVEAPMNRVTRR